MFLSIYSIYVESIIFIRKNILVVFPYFLYSIFDLISEKWLSKESMTEQLIYFSGFALILCLVEVFTIAFIYTKEGLTNSSDSIWGIVKRFYDKAVLLLLTCFLIYVLCNVLLNLVNIHLNGWISLTFAVFLFYGFFTLGLRHSVFYNKYLGISSGIAGLKQLYYHFFFYLLVPLFGILIWGIPSLLSPTSWFTVPFLPIAELNILGAGVGLNWIGFLLSPILFSLIPIALTYAFIFKNKKDKHVS
jgi:hypothetical protein